MLSLSPKQWSEILGKWKIQDYGKKNKLTKYQIYYTGEAVQHIG